MKPNAKVSASVSATACEDESNKTSSSPQSTVASIDDLLIEIFLCIPLKPLFRLKLVSKHWNFIISDHFNRLRNQKNPNPAVGLIFRVSEKSSSYVVSFDKATNGPDLFREIKFNGRWPLNSCNGLLLCTRKGNGIDEPKQIYYVCNPTTNKYFMLPKLDEPTTFYDQMCLPFDPSKSPHYKVVCVTDHKNLNQLQVYSSETGCWRKHGKPFCSDVDFSRGVYWNGAIHWINLCCNARKSLYFNPDIDQVPKVMPTPPVITTVRKPMDPNWSFIYRYFEESCGHLHYIEEYCKTDMNVYEMRTDYSEWFLKYRVDFSSINIDNCWDSIFCALIRGKRDEDSFLVLQSENRIIRYNLVYKTCETILEKLASGASFYPTAGPRHPLQYIESLSHV